MADKSRDYEAELRVIMDALSEHVAEASDDEVITEMREAGEDPATVAERVRDILSRAVTAFEQQRLREAENAYERRVRAIRERRYQVPETPERRRELLTLVMTRKPQLGAALVTLQNREFKNLTDADIQSCLQQLGAIGVLDEFEGSGER